MVVQKVVEYFGYGALVYFLLRIIIVVKSFISYIFITTPKKLTVEISKEEKDDKLEGYPKFDTSTNKTSYIPISQ
jgi:hypothetical protein